VADVDDVDALLPAAVVDREDVAAAEREQLRDAVGLQPLGDETAAVGGGELGLLGRGHRASLRIVMMGRMIATIVGGHGQIGLLLARRLADAGHTVRGTHRAPAHAAAITAAGAVPYAVDLEDPVSDLDGAVAGADAVVFAAGAGPGSGPQRKRTVDLGGAVRLIGAAREAGVRRYVMVSTVGTERAASAGEMGPYLEAKLQADEALAASGLDFTIVRPARLTDDPGTGMVAVAAHFGRPGEVARDDVAAVLHAVLELPQTIGHTFEVMDGDTPVARAVATLA
jgi:uncharacterized protein YbjT (DUF2867 family)